MKMIKKNAWIIPLVLIIAILISTVYFYIIPQKSKTIFEANKRVVKEVIYSSFNILSYYHSLERNGSLSRDQAQQNALKQIKQFRYGENRKEYIWINDMTPNMIMHPYRPKMDGTFIGTYKDPKGNTLFQNAVNLVKVHNEGFISYWWQKHDDKNIIEEKLSFVKMFQPWGWILGTGIYLNDANSAIASAVETSNNIVYLSMIIIIALAFALARYIMASQQHEKDQNFMLSSVVNNIYQFAGLLETDGRVIMGNQYALDSIGAIKENIIGKFFWDTPWWDHSLMHQENLRQSIYRAAHGEVVRFEAKHIDKNNQTIYVDFSIKPIFDQNGKIRYLLPEGKNITEMKRMENLIKGVDDDITLSNFNQSPSLNQLLDIQELQKLQDAFAKATGVASIISDPDGNPITKPSNFTTLCKTIIRKSKKGMNLCQKEFQKIIQSGDSNTIKQCNHGHMWHSGTNIMISGSIIANWFVGQVRPDQVDKEYLLKTANENGIDSKTFIDEYYKIPAMSKEQFQDICNAINLMANQISNLAFKNIVQAKQIIYRKDIEKQLKDRKEELKSKLSNKTKDLDEVNSRLLNTARLAGRAEVATGILHNVGNVLNSIGVGIYSQKKLVESFHIESLEKVVLLLKENKNNISDFITNDPKGKKLFEFLDVINNQLKNDRVNMTKELNNINSQVDHIKDIISMQQALGKVSSEKELVSVNSMINDAIKICQMEGNYLHFEPEFDDEVEVDKIKVLQILINIISNAKSAIAENSDEKDKEIRIKAKSSTNNLLIQVTDNGIGMSESVQRNLFQHGFTTKKDGHGFGLHNSLKLAKEFGGNIAVTSEGKGKGSTFSIYIPLGPHFKQIAS